MNEPAEPVIWQDRRVFCFGLCQLNMDIVVVDILLTLIRSINVGFRILDEVAPFDATDIRKFASPDGRTGITNVSVSRFSVEHILSDNTECIICVVHQTAFGAAFFVFQEIGIGAV